MYNSELKKKEPVPLDPASIPDITLRDHVMGINDVAAMSKEELDEMFTILDFCYNDKHKFSVSRETVLALEQYQENSAFLKEILRRIDRFTTDEDFNVKSFYMRMNTVLRVLKIQITRQPKLLSPLTISRIRLKPEYKWIDLLYDGNGDPKQDNLVPETRIVPSENPLSQSQLDLASSLSQVASVYSMIAGSITYEEIQKLKTMEKINSLKLLSYVHNSVGKFKGSMKFTKINITKGSKEELESAMLDFDED